MGVARPKTMQPGMRKPLCIDCLSWGQARGCLYVVLHGPGSCKTDRDTPKQNQRQQEDKP